MNVAGRKGDGRILRAFEAAKGGVEKKNCKWIHEKGKTADGAKWKMAENWAD